jgi:2-keto-4-pentenoate hydratase/2-oxohepta-3-ene-1,7-dioic acid hydratase in catechol pathway
VDEIGNPEKLDVKLWVGGELGPNYNTSDLAHSIAESIAWATALTPVQPGDVPFGAPTTRGSAGWNPVPGSHKLELTQVSPRLPGDPSG